MLVQQTIAIVQKIKEYSSMSHLTSAVESQNFQIHRVDIVFFVLRGQC